MEAALQRNRSLIVQYLRQPVVFVEDELTGEENGVGELASNAFGEPREFIDGIGSEGQVRFSRPSLAVAEVDEVGKRGVRLHLHCFEVFAPAKTLRVHRARVDEDEVPEVVWEHPLYPEQSMQPAATRGAYQKHRSGPVGVRLGRIGDAAKGNARKVSVDFLQLRLGPVVVVADGDTRCNDRRDDENRQPSAVKELLSVQRKQNSRTHQEPRSGQREPPEPVSPGAYTGPVQAQAEERHGEGQENAQAVEDDERGNAAAGP